MAYR